MISGNLEYLVSSLPGLTFQNTAEKRERVFGLLHTYAGAAAKDLSLLEILDIEAQKFLSPSTFEVFEKINLRNIHEPEFQESKSIVLSSFSKFSHELKEDIRRWRISHNDHEEKSPKSKVGKIIGQGTPLEKEIQIMKYQWEKLEEISVGHFANAEALTTYKIKLMILLRWWSFHAEKGFENFVQMTANH